MERRFRVALWIGSLMLPAAELPGQTVLVAASAEEPTLHDLTLRHFVGEELLRRDVRVLRRVELLEPGEVCLEYVFSVLALESGRFDAAVASSVLIRAANGALERTRPRILHQFHEFESLKEMADLVVEGILAELEASGPG